AWKADKRHQPGKQHIYTHAGFMLLHLALERRFQSPIGDLIDARVLKPMSMADTTLPLGENGRAQLAPALLERTVQGDSEEGEATCKAIIIGREPRRCIPRRAIWRAFSPPTSASCRLTARCKRLCRMRSAAFFRWAGASPRGSLGRWIMARPCSSTKTAVSTTRPPTSV